MNIEQKEQIKELLKSTIRKKLQNYKPESNHMPFHYRLLGKDRMALFSFIHSINTILGTSVFEQTAVYAANDNFTSKSRQYKLLGNSISIKAQAVIQNIIDELRSGIRKPNWNDEYNEISQVACVEPFTKIKPPVIDVFLHSKDDIVYCFDIKTAKPNVESFISLKRKMLEWTAICTANNKIQKIHCYLAIPYNPYEPKPYDRWTLQGLFDLPNEVLVASEFWDFIGGKNTYNDMLDTFEQAGLELRDEIDLYFRQFK
ncbi:MAG: TdeIII family type II restriction endonuclease [Armatimonadota bacterium]